MKENLVDRAKKLSHTNKEGYKVKGSYSDKDCIFLLKDIGSMVKEVDIDKTNKLIEQGINYSEMIPIEHPMSKEYNDIFLKILEYNCELLAKYIANMSESIYQEKGDSTVIVSLARAGTPCGILVKRYIESKYNITIPHYSVSIIREVGLDENALAYIMDRHPNCKIQFVDGWTGKGSITYELRKTVKDINDKYGVELDDSLAVMADPAKIARIAGTREDVFIANCCLNGTISGLVSKTCLNKKFINKNDFHGAKKYENLVETDLSQYFIDKVSSKFDTIKGEIQYYENNMYGDKIVAQISKEFNIPESKIKLSVGEGARALLRHTPKVLLIKNINNPDILPLLKMAKEQNVIIKQYGKTDYEVISLLK